MKVGLIVIATNKYINFAQPLYKSMQKYFLNEPDIEHEMFLVTNQPVFKGPEVIEQEHEPWPAMTLKRYEIIIKNSNYFNNMDYLYYCDADMLFIDKVGKEILAESVGTIHPGYWNVDKRNFPYETNPLSTAYINANEGSHYFIGSFQGGKTATFLNMSETLRENIKKDLTNNIIAIWHDESHLNRYFIDHPPELQLSPSYSFPEEDWARNLPFPKILLALRKDHAEMRQDF